MLISRADCKTDISTPVTTRREDSMPYLPKSDRNNHAKYACSFDQNAQRVQTMNDGGKHFLIRRGKRMHVEAVCQHA